MKTRKEYRLLVGTMIIASLFILGWGQTGHKIINKSGAQNFSSVFLLDPTIIQRLSDSSSVPDWRKYGSMGYMQDPNEQNHFMNMDLLVEYSTRSITHNRDSLFLKYGESYIRNTIGMLPWVIESTMTALTNQMRNRDWNRAWSTAADLGHYIGDAYNPLHATKYYNGNITVYGSGSAGIHSRFETSLINNYQIHISPELGAVQYVSAPLDTAFAFMYESCSYTDTILIADYFARQSTGGIINTAYYSILWQRLEYMTKRQFQKAALQFGSYLYTAWINAGNPSTTVENLQSQISDFKLNQNYPNPFNSNTVISYQLPANQSGATAISNVELKIFDILGKEITTLVNAQQSTGTYSVKFEINGSQLSISSGIYFYRITAGRFSETKRMLYLK